MITKKKNALTILVGRRIAALRKKAGLSQQDLEDKSKLNDSQNVVKFRTLSLIEQGYGEPKITTLAAIARTLGYSLSELLDVGSVSGQSADIKHLNHLFISLTPEQQQTVLVMLSVLAEHS